MEDGELGATASTVITFAQRYEDESARFYEKIAQAFPDKKELFLAFARDGKKNKTILLRTYQETVTDALETQFAFKGLNLNEFLPRATWQEESGLTGAVGTAIEMEKKASEFYQDLAKRSGTLLSTIPTAFRSIAKNRVARVAKLESLV